MKCNNSGNKSQICDLLPEWDVPHRGNKSQICDLLQEWDVPHSGNKSLNTVT